MQCLQNNPLYFVACREARVRQHVSLQVQLRKFNVLGLSVMTSNCRLCNTCTRQLQYRPFVYITYIADDTDSQWQGHRQWYRYPSAWASRAISCDPADSHARGICNYTVQAWRNSSNEAWNERLRLQRPKYRARWKAGKREALRDKSRKKLGGSGECWGGRAYPPLGVRVTCPLLPCGTGNKGHVGDNLETVSRKEGKDCNLVWNGISNDQQKI